MSLLISYCCQASEFEEKRNPNPHSMYIIRENGYCEFNPTVENKSIRDKIDQAFENNSEIGINEIKIIDKDYCGVCFFYAFEKIFNLHFGIENGVSLYDGGNMPGNDWIEKYFSVITEPKKGDLVCYYDYRTFTGLEYPVHYGIYDSNDLVSSKWGKEYVYRHPPFYVGKSYGNFIRYYRLKSNITIETLSQEEDYVCPTHTTPLPEGVEELLKGFTPRSFT